MPTKKNVPTQDEIFDQWLKKYPLTVYSMGNFRRYKDGVWEEIRDEVVKHEIHTITVNLKKQGIRPTAGLTADVTQIAKSNLFKPEDVWDSNPNIIVMNNGTMEIHSRQIQAHSPKDFATNKLPIDYDPAAAWPVWLTFLADRIPYAIDFVQEFFGLCLTPITKFEIALWLVGPAGSGKSTLLQGLDVVCGARAGVLGLLDLQRSRFALTNLVGKTVVFSTEQPASYMTITPLLNQIISGEPIQFEMKFKNPVVIKPIAKMIWAMNEKPRVASSADGLFRRIKILEFPALDPKLIDLNLKAKISAEAPGIFNWALDGLNRLLHRGHFEIPPMVLNATKEFQESSDIPLLFVQDICNVGPNYSCQSSDLYSRYRIWCENNGHKPQSSTSVAEDWKRLGFTKTKTNGRIFWHGIQPK